MEMMHSRLWILFLLGTLVPTDALRYNNDVQIGPDLSRNSINHKERPPTIMPVVEWSTTPAPIIPPAYTISPITYLKPPVRCPEECQEKWSSIKVDLSHMSMGRFHGGVITTQDVTSLDLSHNNITHLPQNSFLHLRSLRMLNLSANLLPTNELLQLHHLNRLSILWLDNNTGSHKESVVPRTESALPHLKELHLRGNGISEFSVSLTEFSPRLTHLYLSKNSISSTEFLNSVPMTLTHLYLDDNEITKIEDADLSKIIELSINRNKLKVLCVYMCDEYSLQLLGAKKLTNLLLSGNEISEFNLGDVDSRSSPPALHILDLSYNKLTKISEDTINRFNKLRDLNLGHNALTNIPNLCSLPALENLDLSGNLIVTIPHGIFCSTIPVHRNSVTYYNRPNLHKLQVLKLSDNQIQTIDTNSFDRYGNPFELDLSDNHISILKPDWITSPENLHILHLENNNISDVSMIHLTGMSRLAELHIMRNPMTYIDARFVRNLNPELRVYFQDENHVPDDVDNDQIISDEDIW